MVGDRKPWKWGFAVKYGFSLLGDVNVDENGVVVEDREIRVLDNGRIRVLRAPIPNPISFLFFSELSTASTVNSESKKRVTGVRRRRRGKTFWASNVMGLL
nr:hypothetical protein CFP56_45863 [Quercus suber]